MAENPHAPMSVALFAAGRAGNPQCPHLAETMCMGPVNQLVAACEEENHCLELASRGVESQAQFTVRLAIVVEENDPQRPLSRLNRNLRQNAVLECTRVDIHAARLASAALIASA